MLPISAYEQIKQGVPPSQFATRSCLSPIRIQVPDWVTGRSSQFPMYISCGACIRCADDMREQWCTRMALHALSYKHVYFVTLTYGSYNLNIYDVHPFKSDWLLSCPVCDNVNKRRRPAWTPSILRHEHLTKYLKRLRKAVGTEAQLSYVACGEYGTTYGRPHFHLIIYSQVPISTEQFCNSWAYDCVQYSKDARIVKPYRGKVAKGCRRFLFHIGRVDVHDLVANGSLNWDDKYFMSRGNDRSARYAFTYVAKYLCKRDALLTNSHALSRVDAAFRIQCSNYDNFPDLSECSLDMSDRSVSDLFHTHINITYNSLHYENVNQEKFRQIVSPFFVCSRARAIGRDYLLQNLQRFSQGSYALPKFCGKPLAFPHYFVRQISLNSYSLRFGQTTMRSSSYVKELLPNIRAFYYNFGKDKNFVHSFECVHMVSQSPVKFAQRNYLRPCLIAPDIGYIKYWYESSLDAFVGYRYNRSTRDYELADFVDRSQFCEFVVSKLDAIVAEQPARKVMREKRLATIEAIKNDPLSSDTIDLFVARRNQRSVIYKMDKPDKQ